MSKKYSNTKKEILAKSLLLFGNNGYDGTSVRDIAKAVGLQQGALYNHFKNKDHILETLIDDLMSSAIVGIFEGNNPQELAKRGKSLLRSIAMTFKLISFDKKNEALFKLMMQEIYRNKSVRELYLEHFYQNNIKKLSAAFFMMMQDDIISSGDPLFLANEFLAPLFFYQSQVAMLKADNKSTSSAVTLFEKHTDLFWEHVSINTQQPNAPLGDTLF